MDKTPTGLKRPANTDPVSTAATVMRSHANSIQAFTVIVATVAGTVVTQAVTFPIPFAVAPRVALTPATTRPDLISVGRATAPTTTGFTIAMHHPTLTGNIGVDVIAIGEGTEVGG